MRHRTILALAVAASAAAVSLSGWSEPRDGDRAAKAKPGAASASAQPAKQASPQSLTFSRPPLSAQAQGKLFGGAKPKRAPAKAAKATPAAAQPPVTPPFPYKYAGRYDAGRGEHVFLQKGDELIEIKPGKMLDGVWRVDALHGDRIDVSFVPGAQQLSMTFASLTSDPSQDRLAASPGVSPGRAVQPDAAPATSPNPRRAQLAARTETMTFGAMGLPASAGRAQTDARRGFAAPITASTAPQSASAGPGNSAPVPAGRLGTDAPASGSMPTGGAPTPTGKLGL
jgi:hypothetical protein